MKILLKISFFALLITIASCNELEPHGYYHSSDFQGYDVVVIDFWGHETIKVFAIKDDELYLSFGKWKRASGEKISIVAQRENVKKDLLETANSLLSPFKTTDFTSYKEFDISLELKMLSFEELKHQRSKKIFKSFDLK